jgi:hypothetical protein
MSVTEMYDILNLITNAQEKAHYVLEFNVNDKIVKDLISSYTVDLDDIVEVADPPQAPTTKKRQAISRKTTILDSDSKSDSSIGSVPDFSPPSGLRTNLPVNEVSGTFSPVRIVATPTFPTEQVETGFLPEQVTIISALHAVTAHNSSIESPTTASNTAPLDPHTHVTVAVPSSLSSLDFAAPTLPTEQVETRFLPEQVIVSALHAVAAHNSSIESPTTASNTTPLNPNTRDVTAVPSSSLDFQSRQKRPRIDSDSDSGQLESNPNEPRAAASGGQAKKRVRLAEPQPNDLSLSPPTVTIASANATTTTKTKETAPRGAKRGLKSKAGAATSSRPKSSVLGADLDEKKEKKKSAAKSSKPLPPRQASKRYAALDIFI